MHTEEQQRAEGLFIKAEKYKVVAKEYKAEIQNLRQQLEEEGAHREQIQSDNFNHLQVMKS